MTETHDSPGASLDQQVALRQAAAKLEREFTGVFGTETIERFLYSSYDQFAGRATVVQFLPLLAERFARQRLQALARVEGLSHDGSPVVLFLCTRNAGRSQMALGFFQHHAGQRAVAWSGGTEPGSEINPAAIEVMRERGIDISGESPSPGPMRSSGPRTRS
jgi:arsenate reductase